MYRARIIYILLIVTSVVGNLMSQDSVRGKLAVLPIQSFGIDANYVRTAEAIYRVEITNRTTLDVISMKETKDAIQKDSCMDTDCAVIIGEKLGAFSIAGCTLSALGTKIIVTYFLANVASKRTIVQEQVTSNTVEDLEIVMKRVAKSIVEKEKFTKGVEVGAITGNEAEKQPRRSSTANRGLSFGYLYPTNGYDSKERSFVLDGRIGYELQDYAIGMLLGIRKGFAMNLYGAWLMTRQDFCPYVGASFGFHWVTHSLTSIPVYAPSTGAFIRNEEKRGDGFEIGISTGLRVFRTYNFQITVNLEYIYTINDFNDGAVVFTLGLL